MVFAKVSRAVIYKIKSILISYFVLLSDFLSKVFAVLNKSCTFALAFGNEGAFSSAGSEHLPYKQRVGGSNPSTPTIQRRKWFASSTE